MSTRLKPSADPSPFSRRRYTASGKVWVRPEMLPAKVSVAPNSPSARAHASVAPATSDGAMSGAMTRRKTSSRDAPKLAAVSSNAGSSAAQRAFDGDDEKRHSDEGLRHHDCDRRERQLPTERVVHPTAQRATKAERGEKGYAAHHRWQDHRKQDQCAQDPEDAPVRPSQHPREGRAQQHR